MPEPVNIFNYARRSDDSNIATDAVDDFFTRKRNAETSTYLMEAPDPARIAKVNKVARDNNLPVHVAEDNLDMLGIKATTDRMVGLMDEYPGIGKWAADKRNAALASDDVPNLAKFGNAFAALQEDFLKDDGWLEQADDFMSRRVRGIGAGFDRAEVAAEKFVGNLMPEWTPDVLKKAGSSNVKNLRERAEFYEAVQALPIRNEVAWSAIKKDPSVGNIATFIRQQGAASIPDLVLAVASLPVYAAGRSGEIGQQRAKNSGRDEATMKDVAVAAPAALLSGYLDRLGFQKLILPGADTVVKRIVKSTVTEGATEFAQEIIEYGGEALGTDVGFDPAEAVDRGLAGAVGGAGVAAPLRTAAEVPTMVQAVAPVVSKILSGGKARAEGKALDDMMKVAATPNLMAGDTDSLKDLLRTMGEDAGTSNVYIDGKAMQEYMQSDSYDPGGPLSSWVPQVEEAAATGGDVLMPIEEAAVALQPAWATLKDDVRLSPGGVSRREAQTFDEAMADVMDELAQSMSEQDRATALKLEPIQKLAESINRKLQDAGFTPSTAKVQADLLVQRYSTRAVRLGKELTGDEFGVTVNNVLPEGLAAARKADKLDLVINSYFTMKDPKTGKTLLDFIAERGGITDRGGDLKSMGLDNRKFKKKVIRDTRQKDMLGAEGNNKYAPDAVLQAAIDEGYFPELQGRDEIDGNVLLEAIGEELRGTPRYNAERIADDIQELAGQLDEFLGQTGFDPTKMTRAEIRAALEGPQPAQTGGFYQSYEDNARGKITFNSGQATIDLFKGRNLSTFLHETGHLWLEELRFDASLPDAPAELKADWETVNKWFASQGHAIKDGQIPVDAHEMWARGVERYLMEGKSPVPALKRIFETFRVWLTAIYKTVDALKSPITPEIRSVMDRLIATDTELAEMSERQGIEALFKDAAEAGMTGAEYAAYVEQTQAARTEASGALIDKTMRAFRARETKRYREAESGVREEVSANVDARPMYKALRLLKTAPMDAAWVRHEFGEDAVRLLPVRVPPVHKEGGLHPDVLAEQSGFATGKEMVETLMGADIAHRQAKEGGDTRSMRERTIGEETDAVMQSRYGDPLNDGSIEREALEAVHNDMQGDVIAAEIRVLARRSGKRATPYAIAKDWARNKIRSGVVRDEASPSAIQRYARAAAKASSDAQAAMLKQDIDGAFKAKQAQMLNNALVYEAKQALDDVTRAVKRLEKIAKRRTMKSVDQDYLEQAQALLENVDMRRRSQVGIDKEGTLAEWAAARQAEGFDVVVSQSFETLIGKTNWTKLSVENLLGLDEAIKQIIHLGRNVQALNDNAERVAFDEKRQEALGQISRLPPKPPTDLMTPDWKERFSSGVAHIDAAMLKTETVIDWLDGGDANGVFNRLVFRPIEAAQDRSANMTKDYSGRVADAMAKVSDRSRWRDFITMPELLNAKTGRPWKMQRQQLISMALNMGNNGNIQRLADGYQWQEQDIRDVLNRELTQEDWQFVEETWGIIDTLWPDIEAMERRLNGIAPEKIEAVPFETPFGTISGGYYPAVYDSLKSRDKFQIDNDLFGINFTRATTKAASTNERVSEVKRPLHLQLGVINRHIGEVIHDITHREAIMQADKFMSDQRIKSAIDSTLGPAYTDMFRPWLQYIANQWAHERAGNEGFAKLITKAASNATMVGMGFRASTVVLQAAGLTSSIEVVGEKWILHAATMAATKPVETFNFVMDRSGEMRTRMDNLDSNVRSAVLELENKNGFYANGKKFAFHGIGYADRLVSIPTWLGAYNKAIDAGLSEDDAIYAGNKAVRQSQGSGAPKDLAPVQRVVGRGGVAIKLFTMFYSWQSANYQRQRTLSRNIGAAVRERDYSMTPKLASRAFWLVIMTAAMPDLIKAMLPGGDELPEDEEGWAKWLFERVLFNALGPIPIVRDVAPISYNKATDEKTFGYRLTPAQGGPESFVKVAGDVGNVVEGEPTKRATRNAMDLAGYSTGLPIGGQISTAVQFMVDVGYDEYDPEGFADWWEGLTKGKLQEA